MLVITISLYLFPVSQIKHGGPLENPRASHGGLNEKFIEPNGGIFQPCLTTGGYHFGGPHFQIPRKI